MNWRGSTAIRDIDEDVRDHVRTLADTEAFEHSARRRKKGDMAFAHLKCILKLDRLRPRGRTAAKHEVLLAATAQNLRKLARYAAPAAGPRRKNKCPLLTRADIEYRSSTEFRNRILSTTDVVELCPVQ